MDFANVFISRASVLNINIYFSESIYSSPIIP